MPEASESLKQVDFIRSQFKHPLQDYILADVSKYTSRFKFDVGDFGPAIDQNIIDIYCKGKFYFLEFGGGISVSCHHGMEGWWSLEQEKHSHVSFTFVRMLDEDSPDEDSLVTLYFTNVRLGDFTIHNHSATFQTLLSSLASGFIGRFLLTEEEFLSGLNKFTHRKRIRDILFDQHGACSGLGNYLIAEIMYVMKLHPTAKLGVLKKVDKIRLYETCRDVTIAFYEGSREKVVYGCDTDPNGYKVCQLEVGSRTAHWVPEIQTLGLE